MKKQANDELVTKGFLKGELEKFGLEMDEKARGYRDDILNKMDEMMGELEQIREDQMFIHHDLKDHEKRITKLENS